MKEYKIDLSMHEGKVREVVSEEVQKKAFKLGYKWSTGNEIICKENPYLFFNKSSDITHHCAEDVRYFEDRRGIKISAAGFLALTPEDVQDEVIVTTEPAEWLFVTEGESRRLVPVDTPIMKTERNASPLSVEFFTRTVAERFLSKEDVK